MLVTNICMPMAVAGTVEMLVCIMVTISIVPQCNAYGYFCAYSATIVWWLCTWGVAPGFILLRFQRA